MKKFYYKFMAIAAGLLLNASLLFAQKDAAGIIDSATKTMTGVGNSIITLVQVIIGVVGALMLAWNFYKRAKGDQQSNDALMGWGASLIFAALFLQVIKAAFF